MLGSKQSCCVGQELHVARYFAIAVLMFLPIKQGVLHLKNDIFIVLGFYNVHNVFD